MFACLVLLRHSVPEVCQSMLGTSHLAVHRAIRYAGPQIRRPFNLDQRAVPTSLPRRRPCALNDTFKGGVGGREGTE